MSSPFIKGMIFDISHFATHDGPGIRTVVFLKGCPLRCVWCHNPESWTTSPQLEFSREKCIGCGNCLKSCPVRAYISVKSWLPLIESVPSSAKPGKKSGGMWCAGNTPEIHPVR